MLGWNLGKGPKRRETGGKRRGKHFTECDEVDVKLLKQKWSSES